MPIFVTVTPGTTVTSSTTLDAATLNLLGTPSVDVTGTVDGGSLSIGSGSVLLSALASQADQTVVGNGSGSSNSPVALTLSGLTASSTTLSISNSAITTAKLDARAVTAAKMFAVDGTSGAKLIGRYTASSGDVETLSIGSNIQVSGSTINVLRPVTAFNNYEAATTYTISNDRANAVTLSALSTSIAPQSASSKVLVQFSINCEVLYTSAFILERVDGASVTPLGVPASPGSNRIYGTKVAPFDGDNGSTQSNVSIVFLDSPASTNSITYRLRAYCNATSAVLGLNRSINDADTNVYSRGTSQVVLQEILA